MITKNLEKLQFLIIDYTSFKKNGWQLVFKTKLILKSGYLLIFARKQGEGAFKM